MSGLCLACIANGMPNCGHHHPSPWIPGPDELPVHYAWPLISLHRYSRSPMCSKLGCALLIDATTGDWRCTRACFVTVTSEEMRWWLRWCYLYE